MNAASTILPTEKSAGDAVAESRRGVVPSHNGIVRTVALTTKVPTPLAADADTNGRHIHSQFDLISPSIEIEPGLTYLIEVIFGFVVMGLTFLRQSAN